MAKKLIQVVYVVNDAALLRSKDALIASEAAAKKADSAVKKMGESGNQAGKSFLNLKTIIGGIAALGLIQMFTNLGKKILDLGIKQEQLNIAFTTFLGSAEKAKRLLAQLNQFALVTPFTPDQVNNAARALLSFGIAGEKIIPTLKMLGDVSAGTGKDLTEMAIIFGQIRSTGRLMGQDLLQLINAGFNPLQIISEKTGKSVKMLKEEMEKGLISFDMVEGAFKTATAAGGLFFNLTEELSHSVGGMLSNVQGNIDEILKNLFAASSGPIKDFVQQLMDLTEAFLELSKSQDQKEQEDYNKSIDRGVEVLTSLAKTTGDVNEAMEWHAELLDKEKKLVEERLEAIYNGTAANTEYTNSLTLTREESTQGVTLLEKERNLLLDRIEQIKNQGKAQVEFLSAIDKEKQAEESKKLAIELEHEAEAQKAVTKALKEAAAARAAEKKRQREEMIADLLKLNSEDNPNEGKLQEENTAMGLWGTLSEDVVSGILKEQNDLQDKLLESKMLHDQEEIASEEDKQERIKDLKRNALEFGLDALGNLLMATARQNENMTDEEKKHAKKEQQVQIKRMIIQGVINSLKALGTPPVPNIPLALMTAGFTAASIGVAKAVGFKEGGLLRGPGTGTSDSIPIMGSTGEFMVNAESTGRSLNLLEAINDRKIDDRILTRLKVTPSGVVAQLNDSRIVDAIERNKFDISQDGYSLMKIERKANSLRLKTRAKYGLR